MPRSHPEAAGRAFRPPIRLHHRGAASLYLSQFPGLYPVGLTLSSFSTLTHQRFHTDPSHGHGHPSLHTTKLACPRRHPQTPPPSPSRRTLPCHLTERMRSLLLACCSSGRGGGGAGAGAATVAARVLLQTPSHLAAGGSSSGSSIYSSPSGVAWSASRVGEHPKGAGPACGRVRLRSDRRRAATPPCRAAAFYFGIFVFVAIWSTCLSCGLRRCLLEQQEHADRRNADLQRSSGAVGARSGIGDGSGLQPCACVAGCAVQPACSPALAVACCPGILLPLLRPASQARRPSLLPFCPPTCPQPRHWRRQAPLATRALQPRH